MDYIRPNDPRMTHRTANLNGKNYHYLHAVPPAGPIKSTIFLIHGWPDLSLGWRYQVPFLLAQHYRIICPDMLGYGGTDAPRVPPESIALYSFKRAADDMRELGRQLGVDQVVLGGHDWGGAIVYRIALYHPSFVTALFSICTPYLPPASTFTPLSALVATKFPNWQYQLQLASGEVEEKVKTKEDIRQFLNALYGGVGPQGEWGFEVWRGLLWEHLEGLGRTRLMGEEVLEWYVEEYARSGMHGPLNWYRTREVNFEDELPLRAKTIDVPVLLIQATKDDALPLALAQGMERVVPNLTKREVETSHWVLWQAPGEVNVFVGEWLEEVEGGRGSKL